MDKAKVTAKILKRLNLMVAKLKDPNKFTDGIRYKIEMILDKYPLLKLNQYYLAKPNEDKMYIDLFNSDTHVAKVEIYLVEVM